MASIVADVVGVQTPVQEFSGEFMAGQRLKVRGQRFGAALRAGFSFLTSDL
jgi:hypothetical protein